MNWENIEKRELKHALWGTTYTPISWAKVFNDDAFVYLNMFCEEQNPKAIYTKANEPVYKDSCLEAFFNFDPQHTTQYLNIEVNANGIMLMGVGKKRHERLSLTPEFQPEPYKTETGWGYTLKMPISFILKYYDEISDEWLVNFYKCGDDCEYEHYLSWSDVKVEVPNFHCPEHFGYIKKNK